MGTIGLIAMLVLFASVGEAEVARSFFFLLPLTGICLDGHLTSPLRRLMLLLAFLVLWIRHESE